SVRGPRFTCSVPGGGDTGWPPADAAGLVRLASDGDMRRFWPGKAHLVKCLGEGLTKGSLSSSPSCHEEMDSHEKVNRQEQFEDEACATREHSPDIHRRTGDKQEFGAEEDQVGRRERKHGLVIHGMSLPNRRSSLQRRA